MCRMAVDYVDFAVSRPEMFTLMFRHDLLVGSGENLRATTRPLYGRVVELVAAVAPESAPQRALALWTNVHGLATIAVNRTLEIVAPDQDPRVLVDRIVPRAPRGTQRVISASVATKRSRSPWLTK